MDREELAVVTDSTIKIMERYKSEKLSRLEILLNSDLPIEEKRMALEYIRDVERREFIIANECLASVVILTSLNIIMKNIGK